MGKQHKQDKQGKKDKRLTMQRQLRLLRRLSGSRVGLSIRSLLDELKIKRATLYRYFGDLEGAGYQLDKVMRNGEARYRLVPGDVPPALHTPRQLHALGLARRLLAPLEGTRLVEELEALLPGKLPRGQTVAVDVSPPPLVDPDTTKVIERAMLAGKRIAFHYAPANGEPAERKAEPLALYVRDQLYLQAVDVDKRARRTFKIARMTDARVLDEAAEPHPEYDEAPAHAHAHAAKIWDGPLVDVVIRISPRGARFVNEWPLVPSQQLDEQPDGAVLVRARVSGIVEAMRWVLRWGKDAQVIEPSELRAAVVTELLRAIAAYTGRLCQTGETPPCQHFESQPPAVETPRPLRPSSAWAKNR